MPEQEKIVITDDEGKEYSFPLLRRAFSTGSVGFSSSGRVYLKNEVGEIKQHTFNINVVEIGSGKSKASSQE